MASIPTANRMLRLGPQDHGQTGADVGGRLGKPLDALASGKVRLFDRQKRQRHAMENHYLYNQVNFLVGGLEHEFYFP